MSVTESYQFSSISDAHFKIFNLGVYLSVILTVTSINYSRTFYSAVCNLLVMYLSLCYFILSPLSPACIVSATYL